MQLQCESRQATLNELSNQLKEKAAAEEAWGRRAAEFQSCVHKLHEQMADSAATIATQAAEIRRAKGKIEELLVIQSALCAKVQELTAVAKGRQDLGEQLKTSHGRIQDGHTNVVALR
jgi:chromosome segregation ATPase